MSLFSKPIMAQFSRFHMREQDAAKLVKEKEDKKQKNAQHVKEKDVSFRYLFCNEDVSNGTRNVSASSKKL